MIRALVLTSTFLRHHYLVNRVAERLDLVGVWQERKAFEPLRYAVNADDERVIREHFEARDASEEAWFGADSALRLGRDVEPRVLAPSACNDPEEVARMRVLAPDVVIVFGTGILKPDLVAAFPGRILNLHLGLSPYYRGAGTNFWPLVNREPECVGATIHYLDEGVDSGPIIAQARPDVHPEDGPHELGNRTIVAAALAMIRAAESLEAGPLPAAPQPGGGRLYRRKDFSAAAIRQLRHNFETGMVQEYLANRAARDARIPIIQLPDRPLIA